ncbi:small GTP-binding protein, putative [Trichomonas vaginalis G3]|uniref:Small GTP-binding protein, putative n=1 Tax=Trichomonas vaginalis (strain ATCC PRA-98 / G3) TaxID=412133 RepID=A2DPD6_TRIV3|nr:craniofacial suture morphogenesis protein family [Trichomonas vaginalis G3]EAY17680.1 small GTP-binding protein, putative [Trichomonas vaginalis G3]KAI5507916.1 craniofacial suture morphogenesis protein family [Trichomonas vaginalis G3]|eukprot:XP_001329815.1 small GTP-binding protein [Trichomonas vaginalis G3]
MSELIEYEKYKVIILGDAGVGKTSLARKQSLGIFDYKMNPTVGASHIKTRLKVEDHNIELMLWDTAGQEQFAALVPMYARGANVCIITGSIVNPDSVDHMKVWKERLYASGENPPIVAAINKIDLLEGAPLTMDEARSKAETVCEDIFFVSARTGDSVDQLFQAVAAAALQTQKAPEKNLQPVSEEVQKENSRCC